MDQVAARTRYPHQVCQWDGACHDTGWKCDALQCESQAYPATVAVLEKIECTQGVGLVITHNALQAFRKGSFYGRLQFR